jgi:hypothetical protein
MLPADPAASTEVHVTHEVQHEAPVGTNAQAIAAITAILNRRVGKLIGLETMADVLGEIGTEIYASMGVAKQVNVESVSWTRPIPPAMLGWG